MIKTAEKINGKVNQLAEMRVGINALASAKARTISDYDRSLAITLIKMRNGVKMQLEGQTIENPPTTIMEKLARGICWKEKLAMEEAETRYKAHISSMDSIKAELNGLQSVNRHLE